MKKKIITTKENIVIYRDRGRDVSLRADFGKETMWASLNEIASVFGVQKSAVSKHLKNIYKTQELSEDATVSKMETVQVEGKRKIARQIEFYNLDAIIAVGYRVNSKNATQFRIWATKTLREHILKGFTINKKVLIKNHKHFLKTVSDIQALLPTHVTLDPKGILDLVKEFSTTWTKIDAYDKDKFSKNGINKKKIKIAGDEIINAIGELKNELIRKGEATDIFAQERNKGSLEGILGNVMQSFGGKDVYATLEEKSAHLLYFIIKNHPFVDGNKRSGAFSFIWFLRKVGIKGAVNINPSGLAVLALLIAESNPEHKDKMTGLVVELLKVGK